MRKNKSALFALLGLVAVILPFFLTVAFAVMLPPQYTDTFVGALNEKYDRLHSVDGEKIVVVGGSSVAFGLDSGLLEEYTGMPVVNFGLYAALGTKLMLDLSESGIKQGDVVIISPEIDAQTLSLYFSADTTLKALDDDFSMVKDVDINNVFNLLGGVWRFLGDKWERYLDSKENPDKPESTDIYQSKYFDEYGDFKYPRYENVMDGYKDINTPIYLNESIFTPKYEEFIEYLNAYIKRLERKGASVYFSYSPMNELAITDSTEETKAAFVERLRSDLACDIISEIDDCIYEAGYFFDTNFHLNDTGVIARTIQLGKDIKLGHGITEGIIKDVTPEAPLLPGMDNEFEGTDANDVYFEYELRENGSLKIVGLSELGSTMTELVVPLGANGLKVTSIAEGAFASSSLEKLVVTLDSNLRIFENGCFDGADNLRELWIYKESGYEITPPVSFGAIVDELVVHVPSDSDFSVHYYWSERGLTFANDAN